MATESNRQETGDGDRAQRGRPRDAGKTMAILEAAGDLFMELGFEGTSMDGVAKRAGVSKQTVYSHFSSKEQLFGEATHATIAAHSPKAALAGVTAHTLENDLKLVCRKVAGLLMSERGMAMFRLLVASGAKGSELGEIFWRSGPEEFLSQLCEILQTWVDRGKLRIEDTEKAARQLVALIKEPEHFRVAIGVQPPLSSTEIERCVDDAIGSFLKIYAV